MSRSGSRCILFILFINDGSSGYSGESGENESGELGERCEYFAEQRTCRFNGQTFILVCCGGGEKLLLKGLSVGRVDFICPPIERFVTEKIFRSPVHAAQIRVDVLIIIQVTILCLKYTGENGRNNASDSSNIMAVTNICVQVFRHGYHTHFRKSATGNSLNFWKEDQDFFLILRTKATAIAVTSNRVAKNAAQLFVKISCI